MVLPRHSTVGVGPSNPLVLSLLEQAGQTQEGDMKVDCTFSWNLVMARPKIEWWRGIVMELLRR